MRRKIVAGNWKMNGNVAFVGAYLSELRSGLETLSRDVDVVLGVPFVLLSELIIQSKDVELDAAAQNVAKEASGAYTGEVSGDMLADVGCGWCLVGHSERRTLFNETDDDVRAKVRQLFDARVRPILCVGETLAERESGQADAVVVGQIAAVFDHFDETLLSKLVVAYEPVWAIGTGKTASPEQAQEMHRVIRMQVAKTSQDLAASISILYGGSVNVENASALFAQEDIDGGLVGGASLKAEDFLQICESMS